MFKAPIKVLHPLLTATQEGNYIGTETLGPIPFSGIILAHSNEAEWQVFKANRNNEAFLDRICVVTVPYCLRVTEETAIYKKLLRGSELGGTPCAPETLEMLAKFCVMTRLKEHENSNLTSKMRVYDGEKLKDTDPKAKTLQEYKDAAGVDEGMTGISTRFAYKTLSETFNYDVTEVAADPVHLMYVLEQAIKREQYRRRDREEISRIHQGRSGAALCRIHRQGNPEGLSRILRRIRPEPVRPLHRLCRCLDRGSGLSRTPIPASCSTARALDNELVEDREAGRIANPKDFRNEVVKFALRYRAQNDGKNPAWTAYEKIRNVIEKRMFTQVEDLLPVISFEFKKDTDTETKHNEFVKRMLARGYTPRQVRRLVEWYMRVNKAG